MKNSNLIETVAYTASALKGISKKIDINNVISVNITNVNDLFSDKEIFYSKIHLLDLFFLEAFTKYERKEFDDAQDELYVFLSNVYVFCLADKVKEHPDLLTTGFDSRLMHPDLEF